MTGTKISVLFVDDDLGRHEADLREHFGKSQPSWTLAFAHSHSEAQDALTRCPPDAVVLDVELTAGGREGLSVLRFVRRYLPKTPVLILTGISDAKTIRDALLANDASDDARTEELDPEALLFKEEILGSARFDVLEWKISRALHKYGRVANPVGVLVTHGTDTMAWGLCYLRYALKNLTANVAVTGSQVPLEGYFSLSDALGNLKTALYLLNRLRPAHLFAVFNNGQSVFSGRLNKYRKWDADAFEGRLAASAGADGITSLRKDWVFIPGKAQRLQDLHLIRTGGTIESQRGADDLGALEPTGDFVWKYLNESLSSFFVHPHRHDLFALDSSNMSYEHWAALALQIAKLGVAEADTAFDPTVKPVIANPLFTTDDYAMQFGMCGRGAVFAGYGGGNANVMEESDRSVLPALKEAVRAGKVVAVTSQVPLEPYDADYAAGLALLEAGGIPCGDLPLADAQVKLSYILGHQAELEEASARTGLSRPILVAAAFLAGVSMRKARSLEVFQSIMARRGEPVIVLPNDPFVSKPFKQGLETVIEACVTCRI